VPLLRDLVAWAAMPFHLNDSHELHEGRTHFVKFA